MPLNQSFVGRTYPPTEPYEVGREKIREFAKAIGDANPAYTDQRAAKTLGHPDVIAPLTFPFVITYPATAQVVDDPELGLDFSRVVHGDQKFTYIRPVHAGDQLSVVCAIEAIKSVAGNDFISISGKVYDQYGGHVVTSTMMLVARAPEGE